MNIRERTDFKIFQSEYEQAAIPFVQARELNQSSATDQELAMIATALHNMLPEQTTHSSSNRWKTAALLEGISCRELK